MGCCLGINARPAPKANESDPVSFMPSSMAYNSGRPTIKDFKEECCVPIQAPYEGPKKILVLCTSKSLMQMKNGKFFNTGHQASETFVPLYHFDKCGFKFDFATPEGSPVAVEEWTFALATDKKGKGYEQHLRAIQNKLDQGLKSPMKIEDVPLDLEAYAAVFFPGGHGPLIDMHKCEALGKLLCSAHEKAIPTILICHAPTALRAAALCSPEFPYKGYKICCFPDKMDKFSPKLGYLPGQMKDEDFAEAALKALGCEIQNKGMDGSTFVDRELVTGASPLACQTIAIEAIKVLALKGYVQLKTKETE